MKYRKCIETHNKCLFNREKFAINGRLQCCQDEIADERLIAQGIIDAIEDFDDGKISLAAISSRLSYASHVINRSVDSNRRDVLPEVKRYSMLLHEHHERIFNDQSTMRLVLAFALVMKNWFYETFLSPFESTDIFVSVDSIRSDLFMLEMSLGLCVLPMVADDDFDDIFF